MSLWERDLCGRPGSSVNIVYDSVLCPAFTQPFIHLFDKGDAFYLSQKNKPWPSLDPRSLYPAIPQRGGVSRDHGEQSAWDLCLCWGVSWGRTSWEKICWQPNMRERETKLKQESAPFKLSSAVLGFLFLTNKDLYIFIQAQILIGKVVEKKNLGIAEVNYM